MGVLRERARQKGGTVLSCIDQPDSASIATGDKYQFRCFDGHEWSARADGVIRGKWCSECRYEAMRLGRNAKSVIRGIAIDVQSGIVAKRRTQVITEVMKAISGGDLPTLDTPIFDDNPK
ncbi:hypothetical protein [Paraburkholderia sp. GAS32]|uniref:hypothetical protein n=1 Tax=Paraburkholderia sp. GAS32 TaxID=3035129 RepID=UPI003D1C2AAD